MTGRTAGENIDDATITSEVKAKLAAEKVSTLTKIGVDTDRRTVYLTGTVDNAEHAHSRRRDRPGREARRQRREQPHAFGLQ